MRPGSPPGRLSWYFSVPLMIRFLCEKKNASGSSGSSGSCTRTTTSLFSLQPVGDVEPEGREVALVVAEQLVVEPDVGEVVDGREATAGHVRGCLSGASIRGSANLRAVPHGAEERGVLGVVAEVVGHDDLAPGEAVGDAGRGAFAGFRERRGRGPVGGPLPAAAEIDGQTPGTRMQVGTGAGGPLDGTPSSYGFVLGVGGDGGAGGARCVGGERLHARRSLRRASGASSRPGAGRGDAAGSGADGSGSVDGAHPEGARLDAGRPPVLPGGVVCDLIGGVSVRERDDAAAEPRAGETSSDRPGRDEPVDECVELGVETR